MRAPDFWRRPGLLSTLLAPMALAYGAAGRLRFAAGRPWRAPVPVLCVGNLIAGGTGKTPVALSLAVRLQKRRVDVHFLTRGHGGSAAGPLAVDPRRHGSHEVGDEALLLARCASTWVARDRVLGCRAAVAAGAEAIIMDDGFQNPSLAKDISLVVVDGGYGFGNGRLIPAGPLREPVEIGLERAQALIIIGADEYGVVDGRAAPPARGVLWAHVKPGPEALGLTGRPVVAFAGIGRPEKFFNTLRDIGCHVRATHAFSDHYPFGKGEIEPLRRQADDLGAVLVTTAKDAVRLGDETRQGIEVLTITIEWEDETAVDAILKYLMDDG